MHEFARAGALDLVRIGPTVLFVPTHDNLYDRFVAPPAKNYQLDRLGQDAASSPAAASARDVTQLMEHYLDALFDDGLAMHMLDIGAWVGDVAIRWAKHAQRRGARFTSACYDPSLAGALIPFNITLNGVGDRVTFHPQAVALTAGTQFFMQRPGNSDSSALADAESADTYRVETVTLAEIVDAAVCDHLITKIDVEGLEAKLVIPNLKRLARSTLVLEFAPRQPQYHQIGAVNYLRVLQATHTLVDIFYLPRPTRAVTVGDPEAFFVDVMTTRPYGYTDILAIPRSLPQHDRLLGLTQTFQPIEPSYMLVA